MSSKSLLLISVGTSLLRNNGGDAPSERRRGWDLYDKERKVHQQSLKNDKLFLASEAEFKHYRCFLLPRIADEIAFRSGASHQKDALPQELSYLALKGRDTLPKPEWDPHVVLLASDTPEGRFCAYVIANMLNGADGLHPLLAPYAGKVEVVTIPGLGLENGEAADSNSFERRGIPNLLKAIRDKTNNKENVYDEIILNFTGGYKGAIPYTTLAAQLIDQPNVRLEYLYGVSDRIVSLPRYPIGLDYGLWHRESALLEASESHGAHDSYHKALDPRMAAVAHELKQGAPENSLPCLLKETYDKQRDRDPLKEFSKRVLEQFLPTRDDLRKRLEVLLDAAGEHIWLGDKLPMAADHAGRHHHNLLELAQVFLTPVLDAADAVGRPFLNEPERFVLLGALLLHDSGHTLDRLPHALGGEVALFRTEIRDLHQFLAYHRLVNNIEPKLDWNVDDDLGILVAWTCMYHRKRMGWTEIETDADKRRGKSFCPFLEMEVPSLDPPSGDVSEAISRLKENGIAFDFPKVVALLRVIDGCDNQARRVGGKNYRTLYEQGLGYDRESFRLRIQALMTVWDTQEFEAGEDSGFIKKVREWLAKGDDSAPTAIPWNFRDEAAARIATGSATPADFLWTEIARLADECALRSRQKLHFEKHALVKRVSLMPHKGFDPETHWHFEIKIEPDDDDNLLDDKVSAETQAEIKCATRRAWIDQELHAELDLGALPNASAPLEHLANASGRRWSITYCWVGLESQAQTYSTS